MPLIEAAGTSVARIKPDSVKNSSAPERNWLSMSVSEPSWLFGNIWISTLPSLSLRMFAAASRMRIVSGCDSGELFAILNVYSAAPARVTRMTAGAKTRVAAVPCKRTRRLVGILAPERLTKRSSLPATFAAGFPPLCQLSKARQNMPGGHHDENSHHHGRRLRDRSRLRGAPARARLARGADRSRCDGPGESARCVGAAAGDTLAVRRCHR